MPRLRRSALGLLLALLGACGDDGGTSSGAGGGTTTSGVGGAGGALVDPDAAASTTGASTTSHTTTTGAGGEGEGGAGVGTGGDDPAGSGGGGVLVEPPFESIPWETGDEVGYGVSRKDSQNPLGEGVFIGYAGYNLPLEAAQAWVTALYEARLRELGVRHVFAVQGPATPLYEDYEIGNSRIAAALTAGSPPPFVIAFAHSSGSYVAHELLRQLAGDHDPEGVTDGAVIYFNLDGGAGGLDDATVDRLRRAYFVYAVDPTTGTSSPNRSSMEYGAGLYPDAGGLVEIDASASGCNPSATWCVHMTPITTTPHDPAAASGVADYTDFEGRPVVTAFLDENLEDAGL